MKFFGSAKRFWLITALVLVGVFVAVGANTYAIRSIFANWETLTAAKRDSRVSEAGRENIAGEAKVLKALVFEQDRMRDSVVDPSNPLPFIEAIEGLGRRLEVRSSLSITGSKGSVPDSFEVSADGPFLRVYSFLRNLESVPFLIEFGNVEIRRIAGANAPTGSAPTEAPLPETVHLVVSLRIVTP